MDIISAVKELHKLSSQELNKLVKDSESFIINLQRENGSETKVDLEKFAGFLPLHLVAVIVSSDRDEPLLKYLLSGIRLLHSLCDLAHRHAKLEQILLDDVKISEQLLDLVFYVLIIMSGYREENNNASSVSIVHSALVACSLHLLTGCISSQWQDLVQVLLAHPKVDIFMDVAFGAVHVAFRFLEVELATEMIINPAFEQLVIYLCHQCEASLQFLHSLCQQKAFRERLVKNKELCRNGGVLFLVQAILKLNISPPFQNSSSVVAAVSRLKAKVLSILLLLCEAESLSYLDEVASCPESFDLAKSIALEVLELLKAAIGNDQKHHSACNDKNSPTGLLQLNAMRLADIFSDDSNFRNYITTCFTKVLTAIFSLPYIDFLSIWCSSELPQKEEDASLEFDPFVAAGRVLDTSSVNQNVVNVGITLVPSRMPRNTYAHQRTALFVKIIANLHCFVPNVCEEQERNLFLLKFLECLRMEPSESLPGFSYASASHRAATVSKNLRSLLSHAESLIPNSLNEEDVQLLRVFFNQLLSSISPTDFGDNQSQEVKVEKSTTMDKFSEMTINEHLQDEQSTRNCLSPFPTKGSPNLNKRNGIQKEGMSENYTFHEDEQVNFRNRLRNLDGDVAREEKDKSCGTGSSVLRESDKDVQNNAETSCSDTGSTRGRNVGQKGSSNLPKLNEQTKETGRQVQGDDKIETVQSEEKQTRKRKRTIMNDYQIAIIEKALLDEPEMQRNAAALHSWSEKLSRLGSEISPAQLKNWLNNRKARLARAGKDTRVAVDADGPPEKQAGPAPRSALDSPGSPAEEDPPLSSRLRYGKARTESDVRTPTGNRNASPEKQSGPVPNIAEDDALISSRPQRSSKMRPEADITICEKESQESGSPTINDVSINAPVLSKGESSEPAPMSSTEPVRCKQGQSVVLLDAKRVEIGKGKVHQSQGKWCGKSLEESKTCVVDITDLKTERSGKLPYPSDVTGSSFSEAEAKFGAVRVMWDCDKVYMWRQ